MLKRTARETIHQLKALVDLSAVLNSSLDQGEVRRRAMEAVKRLLDCEASSLLLLDDRTKELYFDVALGKKGGKVKELRLKMGEGVAGWVAKTGQPALVHNLKRDPRHTPRVDEHTKFRSRNLICVPVVVRGELIGVLQGVNKIGGIFYKQDLDLLQLLANQVGIAIEHARLYETIQETFLEKAEANKMLGLAFQSKGMLELALDQFLKVPPDADMLGILYHLACDFERVRMYDKARSVFEMIAAEAPEFRDVQGHLETLTSSRSGLAQRAIDTTPRSKGMTPVGRRYPGQSIGRYEILAELGCGSLGRTYKGRDPRIERLVALKVLEIETEPAAEELEELSRLFLEEVETAGRLSHPGIVVIFDAGEDLGRPYMAMEYLNGPPLNRWLQQGRRMPVSQVIEVGIQICRALAYAADRGVMHGDVKASNAFLLADGSVKLTDFGTSNIVARIRSITEGDALPPSAAYLSPELVLGESLDGRSDLYSLGILLYALLTGKLPFCHDDPDELMEQIIAKRATPLRRLLADMPVELDEIVDRLLSKEPEARFPAAQELEKALMRIRRG